VNEAGNATHWLPGILAMAVALAAAAVYVALVLSRSRPAGQAAEAGKKKAELEARYRTAIDQLRELKAEQHHLSKEAYESQRAELERKAAEALRAKEAHEGAPPAPGAVPAPAEKAAAGTGLLARHPEWKGALWGGGVVAFFGLLGFLLFREGKPAEPQGEGGMRGPMQSQQGQGPQGGGGDELEQALEHVREHPEDVESASMVAHELIRRQEWEQASQITERALGADPFHVENRIHRAVLKSVRGDPAAAVDLQHLADTYPGSQEALLFLASLTARSDKARALDALERYVSVAPPEEQSVEIYQAMAQFRRELGRPPAP